jgi:hypothetical protein
MTFSTCVKHAFRWTWIIHCALHDFLHLRQTRFLMNVKNPLCVTWLSPFASNTRLDACAEFIMRYMTFSTCVKHAFWWMWRIHCALHDFLHLRQTRVWINVQNSMCVTWLSPLASNTRLDECAEFIVRDMTFSICIKHAFGWMCRIHYALHDFLHLHQTRCLMNVENSLCVTWLSPLASNTRLDECAEFVVRYMTFSTCIKHAFGWMWRIHHALHDFLHLRQTRFCMNVENSLCVTWLSPLASNTLLHECAEFIVRYMTFSTCVKNTLFDECEEFIVRYMTFSTCVKHAFWWMCRIHCALHDFLHLRQTRVWMNVQNSLCVTWLSPFASNTLLYECEEFVVRYMTFSICVKHAFGWMRRIHCAVHDFLHLRQTCF